LIHPLPHIGLLDRLVKTLDVACSVCAKLLLSDPVKGLSSTMLARTHVAVTKHMRRVKLFTCPHCGAPQGHVYLSEPVLKIDWKTDMVRRLQNGEAKGWTVERWRSELKDTMNNWRASYLLRGMEADTLRAMGDVNPRSTKVDGTLMRGVLI
jgi:DNA-directed RNA polymerase beta' subunit